MQRSYEPHSHTYKPHSHNYYGGDSTRSSMDEYLERVTRLQHMPSIVSDYPNYPNFHEVRNKNHQNTYPPTNHLQHNEVLDHNPTTYHDHQKMQPHIVHSQHHAPELHKKVRFVEHEKIVEIDRNGKHEVYEEKSIDVEADGFIQQRHKNFELSKMDTFRAY